MKFTSTSLRQTRWIAQEILKLAKSRYILLIGEIGSGKTTLTKFIAQELGVQELVNSPTFNIMQIHQNLVHIDAYRINGGLEEYEEFFDEKWVVIEWADKLTLSFTHFVEINCRNQDGIFVYEVTQNV